MKQQRVDRGMVGRDLANVQMTRRRRLAPGAILGLLFAGFFLAGLRVQILHLGYALGTAVSRENALEEERRVLQAQLEELRNPARLGDLAAAQGFARAEDIIDLTPLLLAIDDGGRP